MTKIVSLSCLILLALATNAHAMSWRDWWAMKDQQAAQLLKHGNPKKAAALFEDPAWQGVAYYRSGQYQQAIDTWSLDPGVRDLYNRSLAYARLGDFDAAIADLKTLLAIDPQHKNAQDNLRVLEKLKKQQKKTSRENQQAQNGLQSKAQRVTKENQHRRQGGSHQQKVKEQDVDEADSPTPAPNGRDAAPNQQNKGGNNQHPGQSPVTREEEQAHQQALRRVPDDLGGLLREKFLRDYRRRHPM